MRLGVNVDHVATLRQARGGSWPDPAQAAKIAERAGADSVVMHLREDRRHIQDQDLFRAKNMLSIKLNLEMSIHPSVVRVAKILRPHQATLVPEKRMERTTEGGLNLLRKSAALRRVVDDFKKQGTAISLFIDPEDRVIREAARLEVEAVEFHTGFYANARTAREVKRELQKIADSVRRAKDLGLSAYAGHGLDYRNVRALLRIADLEELNIGYSIVARALWVGFEEAVREMRGLVK